MIYMSITTFGIWIYHYTLNALNKYLIKVRTLIVRVHVWTIINHTTNKTSLKVVFVSQISNQSYNLIHLLNRYCDHHAFTASEYDGTPSIIHEVISWCTSDQSFAYFQKQKTPPEGSFCKKGWNKTRERTFSWERKKYRTVIVEVVSI